MRSKYYSARGEHFTHTPFLYIGYRVFQNSITTFQIPALKINIATLSYKLLHYPAVCVTTV
jgi:hypothetical protein